MAINTTYFSVSDGADANKIKAWFEKNAADFFDGFTVSGNALILSSKGRDVIRIQLKDTENPLSVSFYTLGGDVASATQISPTSACTVRRLAKTSCGIAMSVQFGTTQKQWGLFISKTSSGAIGAVLGTKLRTGTASADITNYYIVSENSSEIPVIQLEKPITNKVDMTTFCPIVCCGTAGEYFPDCFVTPFSPYSGSECTLDAEGVKYLYNGYIAMKE